MSEEKDKGTWGVVSILVITGLVVVFLVWRSYLNEGSQVTTYRAPAAASVASVPSVEGGQSLAALAESHFAARRYLEAAQVYRKMLALEPRDAAVYNDLGLALHYAGKSEEAVDALKRATTLDPALQRAWLSYGFVLMSMGRDKPARAALEKTIALNPATPQGIEAKSMLQR